MYQGHSIILPLFFQLNNLRTISGTFCLPYGLRMVDLSPVPSPCLDLRSCCITADFLSM